MNGKETADDGRCVDRICSSNNGAECRHCTPEQMRANAKALIDHIEKNSLAGDTLIRFFICGKCAEYNNAIQIEKWRRGYEPSGFRPKGWPPVQTPDYVYEALKGEDGLPAATREAMARYEEAHKEMETTSKNKAVWRQAALIAVNMPQLMEAEYRDDIKHGRPFGREASYAVLCALRLKMCDAKVTFSSVYELAMAESDMGMKMIVVKYGGKIDSKTWAMPEYEYFPAFASSADEQGVSEHGEEVHSETAEIVLSTAPVRGELGVFVENSRTWVSSKDVAEKFEKNHRDVLRGIKNLDCSATFHARNFAHMSETVAIGNGATRNDPMYLMTRDGFTFLAMGFTGKRAARFKEAYINEFNRMEAELRGRPVLTARHGDDEYEALAYRYEIEKKRASTAIANVRTSRVSEEKMRRQLNKALDALASFGQR